MVNAGRILIMPRGTWDSLTSYEMLDLVTGSNGVAYLARQASVGVNPTTDTSLVYWQPFGSVVIPDGETIVTDASGYIAVNVDNETIIYDSSTNKVIINLDNNTLVYDSNAGYIKVDADLNDLGDVSITSPTAGQTLVYNTNTGKFENTTVSASAADVSYSNTTSGLVATNVQTAIDEVNGKVISIDDTTTSTTKVWSSNKTNTELSGKASSGDLSTLSTTVTNNNTAQNNKHKVTSKTVATTGWTSDTTSQSGTTLYKKTIALSHNYVDSAGGVPTISVGASGSGLPTVAQQEAYDLLQYVKVNGTTLTLFSSAIPTTAYYINVEGAD